MRSLMRITDQAAHQLSSRFTRPSSKLSFSLNLLHIKGLSRSLSTNQNTVVSIQACGEKHFGPGPFSLKNPASNHHSTTKRTIFSSAEPYSTLSHHSRGMRIATLQFAPRLGDVEGNIRRANELLKLERPAVTTSNDVLDSNNRPDIEKLRPDILVLPELAFTGYNFPSLTAITPYLEHQGKGPTAQWARDTATRLQCKVCVGYPEVCNIELRDSNNGVDTQEVASNPDKCYNSMLVVDENGEILLNYRKRFLYYTDETWTLEGDVDGFHNLKFDSQKSSGNNTSPTSNSGQHQVPTTFGICMDINPYKFEAPFTAWEFANRVLDTRSEMVILSTAWLTIDGSALLATPAHQPDMDTFSYWIRRFWPLIERRMNHEGSFDGPGSQNTSEKKVILVFANRTGVEEGTEGINPTATYAGTSTIAAITQKLQTEGQEDPSGANAKPLDVEIQCWDLKGAREEGICFADTLSEPKMTFGLVKRSDSEDEPDRF